MGKLLSARIWAAIFTTVRRFTYVPIPGLAAKADVADMGLAAENFTVAL